MAVKSRKLMLPLDSCVGLNCWLLCIELAYCASLSGLVLSVS
jgi:hypothetical protein